MWENTLTSVIIIIIIMLQIENQFNSMKVTHTTGMENTPHGPMGHHLIIPVMGVSFQVTTKLLLVAIRPLQHQNLFKCFKTLS